MHFIVPRDFRRTWPLVVILVVQDAWRQTEIALQHLKAAK